jgi:hypothetical protein
MSNHDDNKGIIIMGANCLIRMVNDSACRILGYAAKVGCSQTMCHFMNSHVNQCSRQAPPIKFYQCFPAPVMLVINVVTHACCKRYKRQPSIEMPLHATNCKKFQFKQSSESEGTEWKACGVAAHCRMSFWARTSTSLYRLPSQGKEE